MGATVHGLLGGRDAHFPRELLAVFEAGSIRWFVHVQGGDLGNHGFGRKDEVRDNGVAAGERYGVIIHDDLFAAMNAF